jgi:hypothetical protein
MDAPRSVALRPLFDRRGLAGALRSVFHAAAIAARLTRAADPAAARLALQPARASEGLARASEGLARTRRTSASGIPGRASRCGASGSSRRRTTRHRRRAGEQPASLFAAHAVVETRFLAVGDLAVFGRECALVIRPGAPSTPDGMQA